MDRVNENTSARLSASFQDADDILQTPITVEYRIDDRVTKQQIRDWTTVSPASEIEIELTSQDNSIINRGRAVEVHVVTIRANYDGLSDNDYATEEVEYEVKNLKFLQ